MNAKLQVYYYAASHALRKMRAVATDFCSVVRLSVGYVCEPRENKTELTEMSSGNHVSDGL